jgi:hypothetical protein
LTSFTTAQICGEGQSPVKEDFFLSGGILSMGRFLLAGGKNGQRVGEKIRDFSTRNQGMIIPALPSGNHKSAARSWTFLLGPKPPLGAVMKRRLPSLTDSTCGGGQAKGRKALRPYAPISKI